MNRNKSIVRIGVIILALVLATVIFFNGLPISKVIGVYDIKPVKDMISYGLDLTGGVYVVLQADESGGQIEDDTLDKAIAIIRTRIDSLGLNEPSITKQGSNRIRISIPDIEDESAAIEIIGKTAQLEFVAPDGTIILTGEHVKNAEYASYYNSTYGTYSPSVKLTLTDEGKEIFSEATAKYINQTISIKLDGEVLKTPTVSAQITDGISYITGLDSQEEATQLAILIKAGALPVSFSVVQTQTIGPTLGQDSLEKGLIGGVVGFCLILLFMLIFYKLPGLAADIALVIYVVMMMFVLALFKVTLTLPGIAGIVFSIGMAVDANIIIYQRIREEIQNGKTVMYALNSGYSRALTSVLDANITTLIAGYALFLFGSGTIRGFALTLMIGVLLSMFTSIFVTKRILKNVIAIKGEASPSFFGVKETAVKRSFNLNVSKNFKIYLILPCIVILAGLISFFIRGLNLGIDFMGGTIMQIELGQQFDTEDIRQITDLYDENADITYAGENNTQVIITSRIDFNDELKAEILSKFEEKYNLTDDALLSLDTTSAVVGKDLQKQAFLASLVAIVCLLIYITIRFEFLFGVATILALLHDLLIVLSIYSIFQIYVTSNFIAAMLTILGYSINATIVVFDRVREERKKLGMNEYAKTIDVSVNKSLSRTLHTTITTLLTMVAMYIFGVDSIRRFILPMMIGFICGTYSSLFVAGPLWYLFKKNSKPRKKIKRA